MADRRERVTILGDGQMGLVLADALSEQPVTVRLWGPFPAEVEALAASRRSERRLPGFRLPDTVEVDPEATVALGDATLVVNAIPTQFIASVWEKIARHIPSGTPVVCVSKGIENETLRTPTDVIAATLRQGGHRAPIPSAHCPDRPSPASWPGGCRPRWLLRPRTRYSLSGCRISSMCRGCGSTGTAI